MREHGSFPLRKRTPAVPGHEELCHPRTKLYFRRPPYRGIPIFSQSHGPALLKGFVDEYSDIEISLTTDTSDRLVKLVKKEDIHLAIVRGNQEWPESDILLEDAPLYLISAKPIDFSTLAQQPSIRYRSDPSLDELRTRWWRQNFTKSPHFSLTVSDCNTCVEIVNHGLGHSLIPADMLPKCKPNVDRQMIYNSQKQPIYRPSHLIFKEAMLQSTPVRIFVDYVKKYFKIKDN